MKVHQWHTRVSIRAICVGLDKPKP